MLIVGRAVEQHVGISSLWTERRTSAQLGLQHITAVAEAVGQLGIVAEALVSYLLALPTHDDGIAVFQQIGRAFIVCLPFGMMVVDVVAEGKLASSTIHFTVERLIAVDGGERIGELRAQNIAADGFPHLDINNVRDALSIAHTGIVDVLNAFDALHVERLQVLARGNDVVDAHLYGAQIRQCRDAVHRLVNADMGQREFCQ